MLYIYKFLKTLLTLYAPQQFVQWNTPKFKILEDDWMHQRNNDYPNLLVLHNKNNFIATKHGQTLDRWVERRKERKRAYFDFLSFGSEPVEAAAAASRAASR